jgi:hypothetical protein
MIWKKLIPLFTALSILGLQACGAGVSKTDLEETIAGGIAQTQTMQSGMEQGVNATLTAMGKGGAQETPSKSTGTLATATLASATPMVTPTSGPVTVTVSADTWCSKGPGTVYEKVFVFKVGQTAVVVGRDQNSQYWVIEKPDNPAVTCWLWGKYAIITGYADSVPVVTPPPSPTPPITTPSLGTVTAVAISVDDTYINGCNWQNGYTVTITTNGPITVECRVKSILNGYDRGVTSSIPMVFNSAGTQSVSGTWEDSLCGDWVLNLWVHIPNDMYAEAAFTVAPLINPK